MRCGDFKRTYAEDMAIFRKLLVNTLVSGVKSTFLWFALTFWVYLETRSVVATGVIGGAFGIASAAIAPAFGTYVDHHRKHAAMVLATSLSALLKQDLVLKEGSQYVVVDSLLREWIARRTF